MDRPKLRPVEAVPIRRGDSVLVQLYDPTGIADKVVVVPQDMLFLLAMLDGTNSVVDVQAAWMRRFGRLVFSEQIQDVLDQLDRALLLDSERFRGHLRRLEDEFRRCPVRQPCSAGSGYPADRDELVGLLDGFRARAQAPARESCAEAPLGLVAPHIDFQRGGLSYARAYATLTDACDAGLFVIFGTAHFARQALFILTTKSFQTPLGLAATNAELVEQTARRCRQDLFAEELVHKNEHSVEFQVISVQHALRGREFQILPILCSSFEERVPEGGSPREVGEIAEFLAAVREAVETSGSKTCYIAGADLSHVGRHFGDDFDLTPEAMEDVEAADRRSLEFLERLDLDGFYRDVVADGNARHICGLSAIYSLLATTEPRRCELLDYHQATDFDLQRAVTFASLALYP